jgi:mRNA-degrading endonuclease toxin of MazEF toxin-antitoxin module
LVVILPLTVLAKKSEKAVQLTIRTKGANTEGVAAAFCFGLVAVVALVCLEKRIKTLKEKGVLDQDYKDESIRR